MMVIPPRVITDAMLVSSTVPEPSPGEVLWSAAEDYKIGDVRILTSTHRRYLCKVPGVSPKPPNEEPAKWADDGPTNRWAMFDLDRNSATTWSGPITVVIRPGVRVGSLGLVGLTADRAYQRVANTGGVLLEETAYLRLRRTTRFSEYYFGEFRYRRNLVRFDLPQVTGAEITVTLTRAAGPVACAGLVLGTAVYAGEVLRDADSDGYNFSHIDRDAYGGAILKRNRSVPKVAVRLSAPSYLTNKLRELRDDLNATPALWCGMDADLANDYFDTLLILGVYKQFLIGMPEKDLITVSLQLEEI